MSIAERRRQGLEASMDNLSLNSNQPKTLAKSSKKQTPVVADSWEEDADDDQDEPTTVNVEPTSPFGSDTEAEGPSMHNSMPGAPPPTPVTPGYGMRAEFADPYAARDAPVSSSKRSDLLDGPGRRPEKQTATASRMIAGALGVRAPRRTDEQRAYDRAIREKEQKRKDKEREDRRNAEEESERAKASVWDD